MFGFIDVHLESMLDDCYDFHHYSFRKVTVNHYLEMIEFQDQIMKGKFPSRSCIHTLKTLSKIRKEHSGNPKAAKIAFEEYKETDEYLKWEKEFEKRDDDDPIRNDSDPEGWKKYIETIKDTNKVGLDLATKVAP